jgi:hypothetical protein
LEKRLLNGTMKLFLSFPGCVVVVLLVVVVASFVLCG